MRTHAKTQRMAARPQNQLFEVLKVDGTGSSAMNVDGSTPVKFQYIVPAGKSVEIERCLVLILNPGMLPANFAGLAELANGLKSEVLDASDNVLLDYLSGATIQKNADWVLIAGPDAPITDTSQVEEDQLAVRWTIGRSGWNTLLEAGEKFSITVQDNIAALTEFRMTVQGHIEDNR